MCYGNPVSMIQGFHIKKSCIVKFRGQLADGILSLMTHYLHVLF